jgi:N6-adenosine-specific RNA methylase IME4
MSKKEFHPVANIFPLMDEVALVDLKNDIAKHGLREPIWLHNDGRIIDGRNRFQACALAGVEPRFRTFLGSDDKLVAFVVSLNLHRRHLDESQRATVGAKLESLAHGQKKSDMPIGISRAEAAEMLNVGERSIARAKHVLEQGAPELVAAVERGEVSVNAAATIAEAPKEQQREIVARGEKEILEAAKAIRAEKAETRRQERIQNLVEISQGNAPLETDRKYPIIYADPPWRYEHPPMGGNRVIENHYPTMTLDEICALKVADIATPDAVLFMWATAPKLAECFQVISAWGFDYRTCAVWVKDKIGMGYYVRNQHELLLIAKRGEPPMPAEEARQSSVITAPRTEHSAKPAEFYELIERMYPELPKIELFSRSPRDGWASWGNQANAA